MLAWAENRLWRSHGPTTAAALLACRSLLDQSPASYRRGELVGCWDLWFAINLWKERIGEPVGRRFGKLRRSWTATGLELGRVEWRQTIWQRQGNMKGQVAVRLYGMILGLVTQIWNLEIKGLWFEKEIHRGLARHVSNTNLDLNLAHEQLLAMRSLLPKPMGGNNNIYLDFVKG